MPWNAITNAVEAPGWFYAPITEWFRGWSMLANVLRDAFDNWFSVQFNIAGDPRVESEVVTSVASYGRQLGIIEEAMLEMASGQKGEKLKRLQEMVAAIEWVKQAQQERSGERPSFMRMLNPGAENEGSSAR